MKKIICPHCGEENNKDNKNCFECENLLLLNNRYKLLSVLGENIGITYLGFDILTNSKVVIKELSIKAIDRWKTEELFKREGDVLSRLKHKNIPEFIEQFTIEIDKNITYYLVIEHIEGKRLDEELSNKRYSEDEIFEIIREITLILEYLQSFDPSIIHRDIKLSNLIRRDSTKEITLIDFGGVKDVIKPNKGSTVAGTFGYAAPEQLLGNVAIQSDYYSLGMVALVLLTRRDAEDLISNLDLSSQDYNNLSNKMIYIIDKLISNKIKDRFQNTQEILDHLNKNKKEFKNRIKSGKKTKKYSGKNVDKFLQDYDQLDEIWKEIEKRNKKKSYIITFIIITSLIASMFFLEYFNPIFLMAIAGFFLFQNKKSASKKFLEKAFNKTTIEAEIIYVFYEYINKKHISESSPENTFFKSFSRKPLNKTKIMLYRKSIEKHRGKYRKFLGIFISL